MKTVIRILRALFDGLRLRCPQCHQGRMFASAARMHPTCPVCGMPFESRSGEVTGGMMINVVLTETIVVFGAGGLALFTSYSLLVILGAFLLFTILFPILFYRPSRGLWAGILFLTGGNLERD
jgi:uncharacterized protein (DUF983 family)